MKNKFHNKKITREGETFDSLKEYRRFCELRQLEKAGEITGLERQVPFELIPTQREEPCEVYKRGRNKGLPKRGKVIEHGVNYVADFVYKVPVTEDKTITASDGRILPYTATVFKTIVEDTKGFKTKDYIIKRKLMLLIHGIRIKEV